MLKQDASECGETTTDVVEDMFARAGVEHVSRSFLQTFRKKHGYSLHKAVLRKAKEIEEEKQVEAKIISLWRWVKEQREGGLSLSAMLTFDEKPVFCERYHRLIWRPVGSGPAYVRSEGKTRCRETVILPSCANGRKLPIIWIFKGKYQKKVKVPANCPTLVLFTKSGMMNGSALVFCLTRAIIPNLVPGRNVIFLDDFKAHFGAAAQTLLADTPNLESKRIEPPLTK
jgi:hypothetical protein